jgi:prefoldin subunit 5
MCVTGGGSVLKERIAALQAETHDLREQNELLEFRILELEECHENVSNIISYIEYTLLTISI